MHTDEVDATNNVTTRANEETKYICMHATIPERSHYARPELYSAYCRMGRAC